MYNTPHTRNVKRSIKSWLYGFMLAAFLIWLTGCTAGKYGSGCPSHSGRNFKVGY